MRNANLVLAIVASLTTLFTAARATAQQAPLPTDVTRRAPCVGPEDFVDHKVRTLRSFAFTMNGYEDPKARLRYHPPVIGDRVEDPQRRELFVHAYATMPAHAQRMICTDVDWVFVDPQAGNFSDVGAEGLGWAFWEVTAREVNARIGREVFRSPDSDQGGGTRRYIAVSQTFVERPLSLGDMERATTTHLLATTDPAKLPQISVIGDGPGAALASTLLHELGHVEWYERCHGGADRAILVACRRFFATSWTPGSFRWREADGGTHKFGDDLGSQPLDDPQSKGIVGVVAGFAKGEAAKLRRYFGVDRSTPEGSHWPTLFAGVAADEDFAETFRITALSACGVSIAYTWDGSRWNTRSDSLGGTTRRRFARKADRLYRVLGLTGAPSC